MPGSKLGRPIQLGSRAAFSFIITTLYLPKYKRRHWAFPQSIENSESFTYVNTQPLSLPLQAL